MEEHTPGIFHWLTQAQWHGLVTEIACLPGSTLHDSMPVLSHELSAAPESCAGLDGEGQTIVLPLALRAASRCMKMLSI